LLKSIESELKRFKKQKTAAVGIIFALTALFGFVFLCYLQSLQSKNIEQKLLGDTQKAIIHIIADHAYKTQLVLQGIDLPLDESTQAVDAMLAKAANKTQVIEKLIYRPSGSIDDLKLKSVEGVRYKVAQNDEGFSLSIFFELQNQNGAAGHVEALYDLGVLNRHIYDITGAKNYFIRLNKERLGSIYHFQDYAFITPVDSFIKRFIDTKQLQKLCYDEQNNIAYEDDDKSYISVLYDFSSFFDGGDVRLLLFQDISYLTQSKNYMFYTVLLSFAALLVFVVSLFLSYFNSYEKKFTSLYKKYTRDLNSQKTRFENYYKKSPVPVISIDTKRTIRYVNDKFIELLGFDKKRILSRDLLDFVVQDDYHIVKAAFTRVLDKKEFDIFEFRIINSDSKAVSIKMSLRLLDVERGYLQASFLDVSKDVELKNQLEKSRTFLEAILEAEPQILIVTDGKEIQTANKAFFEFFETNDLDSFKAKYDCICELFIPSKGYLSKYVDEKPWIEYLLQDRHEIDKALIYRQSTLHTFVVKAQQIKFGDDKMLAVVVFSDITKEEEIKLRYEFALEGSNDGLWDVNLVAKTIYFSPRWKAMIGYDDEEIANEADEWWSRIHQDDIETVKNSLDYCLQNKEENYENIHRLRHKNGSWVWVYTHGKVIFDGEGKAVRMVGVHTDITSLKLQQIELEKLNKALEYSPFGVMITDSEGIITYANAYIKQLMGYEANELIGTNVVSYTLQNEANIQVLEELDRKVNKENAMFNGYLDIVRKDGRIYKEHNTIAPIIIDGVFSGFIGIKQESSDVLKLRMQLKETEELMIAQSRHAAMGEMIGMIAHQWRQPISIISMGVNNILADIELGTLKDNTLQSGLKDILLQTNHLSQTIDDFRDFFKPDKEKRFVCVNETIEEALSIIQKSLENNEITLMKDFQAKDKLYIYDKELVQVLINIVKNAKEAIVDNRSEKRTIQITTTQERNQSIIEICDSGGGIDEGVLPKVFDPYFSTKDEQDGTGLGLYMSKTIIQKHLKGSISAYNGKNGGACFKIILPIEKINDLG
jgi:PAS domain S-box-containing protein